MAHQHQSCDNSPCTSAIDTPCYGILLSRIRHIENDSLFLGMRLFFLFAIVLLSSFCQGQSLRMSHLDQKQGLSQNTPTAFLQDRDGFMWVGTQDGLNRYDGYSFTVFRHDATDTNSLSDNFILCLDEDSDGNIWIGTRNGLCVYVKAATRFYRYYFDEEDRKQYHANIRNVIALRDGGIVYQNYQNRLVLLIMQMEVNQPHFSSTVLSETANSVAYCKSLNRIAFQSADEISIGVPGKQPDQRIKLARPVKAPLIMIFTEDVLFINDSTAINKYDLTNTAEPTALYQANSAINAITLDASGRMWIGTNDGLRIVHNLNTGVPVTMARENPGDFFSIKGDRVESVYMSRDNMIWIGTVGAVNIYDPLQTRFSVLQGVFSEKSTATAVWFVMSFGDITLWSTDDGLNYKVSGRRPPEWLTKIPDRILFTAACFDSFGRLWIGSKRMGVFIVDTVHNIVDDRFVRGKEFAESVTMDMLCTSDSEMWIASIGSLCLVDVNTLDLKYITHARTPQYGISGTYFTSLEQDNAGNVYAASSSGIYRFDKTDTSYVMWKNNPLDQNSLCYNIVNDLAMINDELWIATMGSGLDRFNPARNTFTHYTTRDGLPNNTVYGIEYGSEGKIWLSTNDGLVVLDPSTGTSRNFTMRDGLPSNEYVINKHARNASTGDIYFGSASGLVRLNPEEFTSAKSNARPVVTRLRVNYKDFPFADDTLIHLTPRERNINIDFTAIDFRNQDKISYTYKLEGFDTTWHTTNAFNRNANFTNLPYGEYFFLVKYKISGEPWSDNVLRLKIVIATPFYATAWFMILAITIGVSLVALIVRYISQRKLRKQLIELKMQEQIRHEKERISRDLHDNVGAQLTYVISSLDNLSYNLHKNPVTAKESDRLEELSGFARGTMDQLRESIWAINSEQISLSELAGRWKQYLSELTESKTELQSKVSRSGADAVLKPTVAIEIHRIVQEAINNAFKHSGGSAVEVEVIRTEKEIEINVRDNGQGMNGQNSKPGHYGLLNMKERAEIAGGKLVIDSGTSGTTISVKIAHN